MSSRSPRRSVAILVFAALLLPVGGVLAEPIAHGGRFSAQAEPLAHGGRPAALASPVTRSSLSTLATAAMQIPLIQFLVNFVIDASSGGDMNG